jgi:GxxExxY protein
MMNHEGTKDTKTHEGRMLKIVSPLSEDLENLAHDVIACCLTVHKELGPGLLESVYPRAVAMELEDRGISFEMEKPLRVNYRGQLLCHQRLDMFIDGRLVLELKSVEVLHPIHVAQVVSYLRLTKARLGLLINFNVPILKQGIRRIVL